MIATYAQGLALLQKASATYAYGLDLEAVARIWRGGCIIRAALLEDIRAAYQARADLPNLLMDPHLGQEFLNRQADLREVVKVAAALGLPAPGLMADPGLFRRLPQRRAAGQPDPGPAGLLRGPYLRTPGRPRHLPHPVGGGVMRQETCRGAICEPPLHALPSETGLNSLRSSYGNRSPAGAHGFRHLRSRRRPLLAQAHPGPLQSLPGPLAAGEVSHHRHRPPAHQRGGLSPAPPGGGGQIFPPEQDHGRGLAGLRRPPDLHDRGPG